MSYDIYDNGYVFNGGQGYTFTATFYLPYYQTYLTRPGVSLQSIGGAIANALARDGSGATVPAVESTANWVGSAGQVQIRVNYRPVNGRGIVSVGQTILDAANALVGGMPANEAPAPAPRLTWYGAARPYVVDPDTIQIGQSDVPPTWGLADRIQSTDPSRDGNTGAINRIQPSAGPNVTLILAIAGGLVALGVVAYAAKHVAELITAVKD